MTNESIEANIAEILYISSYIIRARMFRL